jgi:hypothetical protein
MLQHVLEKDKFKAKVERARALLIATTIVVAI